MTALKCILVTAGSGDLAEAVGGVLKETYPEAEIHCTEVGDPWPAAAIFDQVHSVPFANAPAYTSVVTEIAGRIGAQVVIPCHDSELQRLASDPGPAATLPLLMPNPELITTFGDKLGTARWLSDHGIEGPTTFELAEAPIEGLPYIVKPRVGAGSRGIQLVENAAHLEGLRAGLGADYIAQTYLPGDDKEYTCTVFRIDHEIRLLALRRVLKGGRTVTAEVVANANIDALLSKIAEAGDLNGVLNVQLRLTDQGPMVFEINPRFSSTVRMRHLLGFSDLIWTIEARHGMPSPSDSIAIGATVYRLSREVVRSSS